MINLAGDLSETTIGHFKGLVTLMRTHKTTMDYGRGDLVHFQCPEHLDDVRLQWGRDYRAHQVNN